MRTARRFIFYCRTPIRTTLCLSNLSPSEHNKGGPDCLARNRNIINITLLRGEPLANTILYTLKNPFWQLDIQRKSSAFHETARSNRTQRIHATFMYALNSHRSSIESLQCHRVSLTESEFLLFQNSKCDLFPQKY